MANPRFVNALAEAADPRQLVVHDPVAGFGLLGFCKRQGTRLFVLSARCALSLEPLAVLPVALRDVAFAASGGIGGIHIRVDGNALR